MFEKKKVVEGPVYDRQTLAIMKASEKIVVENRIKKNNADMDAVNARTSLLEDVLQPFVDGLGNVTYTKTEKQGVGIVIVIDPANVAAAKEDGVDLETQSAADACCDLASLSLRHRVLGGRRRVLLVPAGYGYHRDYIAPEIVDESKPKTKYKDSAENTAKRMRKLMGME